MCIQHGPYVGYPYVGLHRFAHFRRTWALCGLPIYEFALVLPLCVRHRLYVGYSYMSYVGLHIYMCLTWGLCGLPICGFAHLRPTWVLCGLPMCIYIGFAHVCRTCALYGYLFVLFCFVFCAYLPENFVHSASVKIHRPRIQNIPSFILFYTCTYRRWNSR